MRFETFPLPNIERRGENLVDLDLSPSGHIVALASPTTWDAGSGKTADNMHVTLHTVAGVSNLEGPLSWPMIRAIDDERVVVVHPRADRDSLNAIVLSLDGTVLSRFHVGDAVEDVLVMEESLVVTYFDEAVEGEFGSEGLCVFDLDGSVRLRFHEEFGYGPMFLSDCYTACLGDGSEVWVSASINFDLVCLDVESRHASARPMPDIGHGANALTLSNQRAYFGYMFGARSDVIGVDLASGTITKVKGSMPGLRRNARGLQGGRFLSGGADSFTLLELEA